MRIALGVIAAIVAALAGSPSTLASEQRQIPLGDDISLVVETRPFDPGQHKVRHCRGGAPCLIDGKPVYGADRSLPSVAVVSLVLVVGKRRIPLESSGMYNPWSPRDGVPVNVWISRELADRLVVRGEFSEGAAAYYAEWEVVEDSAVRTILKCAECLTMTREAFERGRK